MQGTIGTPIRQTLDADPGVLAVAYTAQGCEVWPRRYAETTNGDDAVDGLSPDFAWETIGKVNGETFNPGESVLFKRGEAWTVTRLQVPSSGIAGNPIIFGPYGTGANPLIDMSLEYNDFTLDVGFVWERNHAAIVNQVWEDGARFIKAVNYGAMVQGSWFQGGGVVYVWCTDDGNPNTEHVITHPATSNSCFDFNGQSYITVQDIDLASGAANGFDLRQIDESNHLTMLRCKASHFGLRSFDGGGAPGWVHSDIDFIDCVAEDSIGEGFWIGFGSRLRLIRCEAFDIDKDVSLGYPSTNFGGGYLVGIEAVDCLVDRGNFHDIYYGAPGHVEQEGAETAALRTIVRRTIHNQNGAGGNGSVSVMLEGNDTQFYNNIVIGVGGNGVQVGRSADGQQVLFNTIYVTSSDWAFYARDNTNLTFKNNIIMHPGVANLGIGVTNTAQASIDSNYNMIYRQTGTMSYYWQDGVPEYLLTFASWQTVSGQDANSDNSDPAFVTPGSDFHLQVSSPCRGAGATGTGITDDYDGVTRGDPPDIGAYEYVA